MSLFYQTLDEHRQLLEAKGYDEKSLGAAERDGWFMRELRSNFSLSYNQALRFDEVTDFGLKMTGFFNDNRDIVHFNFNYEFDPRTLELKIKTLAADLGSNKLTYQLKKNDDLPSSVNVYNDLALARKAVRLKNNPSSELNLIIEEQALFLDLFGYYKTVFPNPPNYVKWELKDRLKEIVNKPSQGIKEIKIERELHLLNQDKMNCLFQYKYDPSLMLLNLESITARIKDVEKSFQVNRGVPTLTVENIYNDLISSNRLTNAFQIAQHIPQKNAGHKI